MSSTALLDHLFQNAVSLSHMAYRVVPTWSETSSYATNGYDGVQAFWNTAFSDQQGMADHFKFCSEPSLTASSHSLRDAGFCGKSPSLPSPVVEVWKVNMTAVAKMRISMQ